MIKKEDKERKVICLPAVEEYDEMTINELTKVKKKVENLLDFISKIIRSRIQK